MKTCQKHKRDFEEFCPLCHLEKRASGSLQPVVVPPQLIDDVIRCVAIIALSGNVMPPEMGDGNAVAVMGYTAAQHKACVERCQKTMNEHDLWSWNATTKELSASRIIKRRRRHNDQAEL